ncbi:hypothetical protein D9613_007751 [Agrocybe pediades]|uniref:DUF6534 domain-containing protein n=1 Tax=Agrocybe pediades TaxID=84607 RepID=A0A8H4VNE4_9AGAR|nr:hypothetical protein D9613_007751 [Agrocybe pediades]
MPSSLGSFEDTFGAMLTGAFIAMTIYGITTLQAYFYYMSFPNDDTATKLMRNLQSRQGIGNLDFRYCAFNSHVPLHSLLPEAIIYLYAQLSPVANVLLALISQSFFTRRIFLLCSLRWRYWVAGIISVTVVAHFVTGINTAVHLFQKKEFSQLKEVSLSAVVPFGASTILSDILVAASLCFLLDNNRSQFDDTNSVINRLIIFAINRCILTTAVAVVETIVFTVLPNTFYSFAIDFVIGKLYANSLLAVLNARANLRGLPRREHFVTTEMSTRFDVEQQTSSSEPVRDNKTL